ncbi:magnesium-translocating P-type ATPase [Actinocrispum wychmicini]|uniref:Magnesium-transporting ATPase, P-type 1 n=1 Tax=Actinocrispum wychmicini TaxID=1213861 RepID=A0A4R2JUX9_9PSEU|nr:magnesium-translocating P-type ATPase [Actinocrispum wychmicini]TCO60849.1 Mg2+-importing ATPase [Actinocrispum wychmicini]
MFKTFSDDARLRELANAAELPLFRAVHGTPKGLTEAEAADRLAQHGDNHVARPTRASVWARVRAGVNSPFIALLTGLCVVFVVVGDVRGAVTVGAMVVLAVGLRFWQHTRSDRAVDALRARVSATATVRRRASDGHTAVTREVPVEDLVLGDVVLLVPGDVVPADVRLVSAVDLMVDQSGLSGETLPERKGVTNTRQASIVDIETICFAGTSVVAGTATAVVVATGSDTYFGTIARDIQGARPASGFDLGVRAVGWTLVKFMLVMVPIVLAVNGFVTGDWAQAAMFAAAVAVGLTPEMLPVIVTTNLARGAVRLAERKVVVKRLNAIQDLGAMDVLCVDKTGTLTEDRVAYAHSIDLYGQPDGEAAEYAYLAVRFQSGPRNRLDEAIADQLAGDEDAVSNNAAYSAVDEIGFDHDRRRATVVVRHDDEHIVITKGDPDQVLPRCAQAWQAGAVIELTDARRRDTEDLVRAYAEHGMRILAVAARQQPARLGGYSEMDEAGLVLVGFVGFVDPVRASTATAVRSLDERGVSVKILTGDNQHVAAFVAGQAGLRIGEVVQGHEIDRASAAHLRRLVTTGTVFAKLTPANKARIVAELRSAGHSVGFVGDGVNDALALRAADVGISVQGGTDVAKDAADLILTERDLSALADGVVEGRRTLGNTMKYVKITASSNFGNVLSVLVASAFLPFLPMLPVQLMVQNLLYDTAQLALPWDRVDREYLKRPRRWQAGGLVRFMLVFGPVSSLFDVTTFAVLWWALGTGSNNDTDPTVFQTGWFVEGLLSQLIAVLVLRSIMGSRPSRQVLVATCVVAFVALALPLSPLAGPLLLSALPLGYFPWLVAILAAYGVAAQLAKTMYTRRTGAWL